MLNNNLILLKENKKKMDTVSRVQRAEMRGSCLTHYKRHTFHLLLAPHLKSLAPHLNLSSPDLSNDR